ETLQHAGSRTYAAMGRAGDRRPVLRPRHTPNPYVKNHEHARNGLPERAPRAQGWPVYLDLYPNAPASPGQTTGPDPVPQPGEAGRGGSAPIALVPGGRCAHRAVPRAGGAILLLEPRPRRSGRAGR